METVENINYPVNLTKKDIELVNLQCEHQKATSKGEIEGFANAYSMAKEKVLSGNYSTLNTEELEEFIIHLAEVIEPRNTLGYRRVAVVFRNGNSGLNQELVPGAMTQLLNAVIDPASPLDPIEIYTEFQKIHPFVDGNGRVGDLLWKMETTKRTGEWPEELPPNIFK